MNKTLTKAIKSEKGFTLIELIIVIAVLGILAMILLPKFTGFKENAVAAGVLSEAKNVNTAVDSLLAQDSEEITVENVKDYLGITGDFNDKATLTIPDKKVGDFTYVKTLKGKTYTAKRESGTLSKDIAKAGATTKAP